MHSEKPARNGINVSISPANTGFVQFAFHGFEVDFF
jgi:hypothetical protein